MARMFFDLKNLDKVDLGKAMKAFHGCVEQVVRDCIKRPGDKKVRRVELVMLVTPKVEPDGEVILCDVSFEISAKLPKWKTGARPYMTTHQGQLIFNPDAPDNPEQVTQFGEAEEE
jgi:hypothetical protein